MVRTLHVARRSALKAHTVCQPQLRALLVTAPEELRAELRGLSTAKLVAAAARFRPGDLPKDPRAATKLAMYCTKNDRFWYSNLNNGLFTEVPGSTEFSEVQMQHPA